MMKYLYFFLRKLDELNQTNKKKLNRNKETHKKARLEDSKNEYFEQNLMDLKKYFKKMSKGKLSGN